MTRTHTRNVPPMPLERVAPTGNPVGLVEFDVKLQKMPSGPWRLMALTDLGLELHAQSVTLNPKTLVAHVALVNFYDVDLTVTSVAVDEE